MVSDTDDTKTNANEHINEKVRTCPCCKQEVKMKIGLGNFKNLFRKPTIDEWITLFIIIMMLFAVWAYKHDIQICRELIDNSSNIMNTIINRTNDVQLVIPSLNISSLQNFSP